MFLMCILPGEPVYGESGTYLEPFEHLSCGNKRMVANRRFF